MLFGTSPPEVGSASNNATHTNHPQQRRVSGGENSTPDSPARKKRKMNDSDYWKSSQEPSIVEPIDHPVWSRGNFEVISSDDFRFRIPDYILFAASKVFADAHALAAGEKRLEFDGDNETSKVFEMFLDLVTKGYIELDMNLTGIHDLVSFLKKWDCRAAMANLFLCVQSGVIAGDVCAPTAFIFAASVDDVPTAKAALHRTDRTWMGTGKLTDGAKDCSVLNPLCWPAHLWAEAEQLDNLDYVFAMSRAFKEVGGSRKLPKKFVEYLEAAKALRKDDAARDVLGG